MGTAGTILGLVATVIGTCTFPVGTIITGVLSAAASLAALFCSTSASLATKYVINVSDPMYIISAKLGDLEGILNQLFVTTLTEIGRHQLRTPAMPIRFPSEWSRRADT